VHSNKAFSNDFQSDDIPLLNSEIYN
jgi:hypothetical protein